MYGDFMGTSSFGSDPGGTSGWIGFYWWDVDKNEQFTLSELYWAGAGSGVAGAPAQYAPYQVFPGDSFHNDPILIQDAYGVYYGGFASWATRNQLSAPYDDKDTTYGSTRTTEFMLTVEREIFTDFAITVNASFRRYDHFNWELDFYVEDDSLPRDQWIKHIEQQDWYVESPYDLPDTIDVTGLDIHGWNGSTGEANDHPWYYEDPAFTENGYTFNTGRSTSYDLRTRQPGYYRDFYGIDIIFNKRLSNKWMLNGSLTLQSQAAHFGDDGYMNPTNLWAEDGRPYAPYIGGASGKINQYTYSRWLVKAGGLYQLPYDINVSFTFLAREGWIIRERVQYRDYRIPQPYNAGRTAWLYLHPFSTERMNTFYRFDIRLEKSINLGDTGRIYLMADLFNVFNSKLENRRYQKDWGTFYMSAAGVPSFTMDPNAYDLNEILNPRILRFGVRFQF